MNAKDLVITPDENTQVQSWVLPGVTGSSVNSQNNKIVKYIDLLKEEDDKRAERDRKIQEELQKGFQEGLVKGQAEAFNSQDHKYQTKIQELATIIGSFTASSANILNQIEESLPAQVVNIIISIVKAIIKVEVKTNPEIIQQTVKDALLALPRDLENIKCLINPQDLITLNSLENIEIKEQLSKLELIADENIMLGGCLLKTLSSSLDATLETRMLEILQRVSDERKHD